MSSSAAAAQFKLDANSNAIALIADVASAAAQSLPLPLTLPLSLPLPLPLPPSPTLTTTATTTPADRIEWSRSTILNFIEDYRRQRVLWDPNTKGYHIKQTKYEALKLLSGKYGTEIRSIRSKIKSLRSSFHREHGKVLSGRSRGVHYQPMWFAYEAIRFILDGERDHDQEPEPEQAPEQDQDRENDLDPEAEAEVDEKLALMHSLDLEQLKADKQQQVERDRDLHNKEFTAHIAATVAAVAAAAAAANARDRERDRERDADSVAGDALDTAGDLDLEEASGAVESSSAAVTRSSSDLDGENYCNISAEDVKTEIIEHESELGMLDRRTSTPSPINYYKPTDLTYNHRKRKAMDECSGVVLGGVMGVEHVVGALTLTPIKASGGDRTGCGGGSGNASHQQQQQQMNHSQLAFQALQQHFSHSHSLSLSHCNGQPQQQQQHSQQQSLHMQQQQQQQQQHSSNMAQKRDRDRDLLHPPTSNGHSSQSNNTSLLDPAATSSTCSPSSNSGATPPKPINGLSSNHVDEYGVFGEYVAITIRKLKTSKSKIVVKHLINNLLYEAELGKYDQGMPASKEPPQLYKMQ